MVLAYKTIQFLLVIAIALIFSHVFISGMLLNFLLLMPFCKAWLVKGGKSQSSKNELYTKILSGQIPCLEYSRALVNSLCGFFYFTLVASILFVAKLHEKDIKVVESMQAAMPCPECGKQ